MTFRIWTSIKRWWKNHRWVDVRDNYIIPHKLEVFWMTEWSTEEARKFRKEHPSRLYQYCFTPGSIGTCITIKGDGAEQNITDYGSW